MLKFSTTKRINGYTELEYRKIFKFGDFLLELEEEQSNNKFTKEEMNIINNLIDEGYKKQAHLDRKQGDDESYKQYLSNVLLNISLQDDIMKNIVEYIANVQEFIATEEKNKENKGRKLQIVAR